MKHNKRNKEKLPVTHTITVTTATRITTATTITGKTIFQGTHIEETVQPTSAEE